MKKHPFIPLPNYHKFSEEEMIQRSLDFKTACQQRRTVREFSSEPVPHEVIDNCLIAAGTAPNGANLQPWHFVVIKDATIKSKIRVAAEEEEIEFYRNRAPQEWLDALAPLGTDEHKPFLEEAPYLIAIFEKNREVLPDGKTVKHYYAKESIGIATGFLVAAIHYAGLVSLTHTPSPMKFLNDILERPKQEKPFLLLVVGYPAKDATVPDIQKKALNQIATYF